MLTRRTLLRAALAAAAANTVSGCVPQARGRGAKPGGPLHRTMPFERIAYGTSPQQYGELTRPAGGVGSPVVVVIHGGFWQSDYDLSLMVPVCEALAREGYATWNIEYRRVGDAGGGWPGTFLDVGAATDHLRTVAPQTSLDLRKVVTLGHSAGGQLALWVAGRRWIREGELQTRRPIKLRGAIALAGIVELGHAYELGMAPVGRLMGGSPLDVPQRYATGDPAALLPLGVPQVLVHGSADAIVPVALSAGYQREATSRGDEARLVELPGTGHFELINPTAPAWGSVRDSLRPLVT
jgi:acetyl esterase/lipase